jgi:hypothetical protein
MDAYYLITFETFRLKGLQTMQVEADNILSAISQVYELRGYVLIKSIELK